MLKKFFLDLYIGFKRSPFKIIGHTFLAYASIWTIIESILVLVEDANIILVGTDKIFCIFLISFAYGLWSLIPTKEITITIKNAPVKIKFGDLFKESGFKVIPVSRFIFETDVFPSSLQSAVIKKYQLSSEGGRGLTKYIDQISASLGNKKFKVVNRDNIIEFEKKYYALGTTVSLELEGEKFFLFSLTKTEKENYIKDDNCNIRSLWIALEKFWEEAKNKARGARINIPLIGGGISDIKLSPMQLLELNLISIENAMNKPGKITNSELCIIIHESYYEQIDLSNLKILW